MKAETKTMSGQLMEIAARIREMRLVTGLSETQMAEKTDTSVEEYRRYEAGELDFPFTFIHKCAIAFGITIADILEGESPKLSSYMVTRKGKGVPTAKEDGISIQNLAPLFRGKLAEPSFADWMTLADYTLVEADGSKGLPLKAHAPHEPVIPPQSNQTILVLGAEGLGRTVAQAAHRPALYARLAGAEEGSVVTPALAARMLRAEGLHDRVFVNQADDWERWADAVRALAAELDCPVAAGSLRRGVWRRVQ